MNECETQSCSHLPKYESMNCVNECTSKDCYNEIYKDEPLEDGEIDTKREKTFKRCLRDEALEAMVSISNILLLVSSLYISVTFLEIPQNEQ